MHDVRKLCLHVHLVMWPFAVFFSMQYGTMQRLLSICAYPQEKQPEVFSVFTPTYILTLLVNNYIQLRIMQWRKACLAVVCVESGFSNPFAQMCGLFSGLKVSKLAVFYLSNFMTYNGPL